MNEIRDHIRDVFAHNAAEARILSVKIEEGPRSGCAPYLPRAKVSVLCDGFVGKNENLRAIGIVKSAGEGIYRQPNISVMNDAHRFQQKPGVQIL